MARARKDDQKKYYLVHHIDGGQQIDEYGSLDAVTGAIRQHVNEKGDFEIIVGVKLGVEIDREPRITIGTPAPRGKKAKEKPSKPTVTPVVESKPPAEVAAQEKPAPISKPAEASVAATRPTKPQIAIKVEGPDGVMRPLT